MWSEGMAPLLVDPSDILLGTTDIDNPQEKYSISICLFLDITCFK